MKRGSDVVYSVDQCINRCVLEIWVLKIVGHGVAFAPSSPLVVDDLLLFAVNIIFYSQEQSTGVDPFDPDLEDINLAIWQFDRSILAFFPLLLQGCTEEPRVQTKQGLVDVELFLCFTDADEDWFRYDTGYRQRCAEDN